MRDLVGVGAELRRRKSKGPSLLDPKEFQRIQSLSVNLRQVSKATMGTSVTKAKRLDGE
jgi:hypothetical protein